MNSSHKGQGRGVFFDLCQNKWWKKQWWNWWFETPSLPLWRHCNNPSNIFQNWIPLYTKKTSLHYIIFFIIEYPYTMAAIVTSCGMWQSEEIIALYSFMISLGSTLRGTTCTLISINGWGMIKLKSYLLLSPSNLNAQLWWPDDIETLLSPLPLYERYPLVATINFTKIQQCGTLMFSLLLIWTNCWAYNWLLVICNAIGLICPHFIVIRPVTGHLSPFHGTILSTF